MTGGRLKMFSLLGIVLLAALVFTAWSQNWFTLTVQQKPFAVAGSVAGSALAPIALASLALLAALAIAGPFFRVVLGVLLALLGVCVVVVSAFAIANPVVAATAAITKTTGVAGAISVQKLVTATSMTAWPIVAIVLGVLLALLGLAIAPTARSWPESGRKYTRSRLVTADADEPDPVQEWDALSQGDDPTRR
ncbi:MAG: Trp biosynthesis-associated membrane protein [Actinomycetota bacterium]|nr:Trp biosynthesis-associated membrane protein [Actinomycetota bacterium]